MTAIRNLVNANNTLHTHLTVTVEDRRHVMQALNSAKQRGVASYWLVAESTLRARLNMSPDAFLLPSHFMLLREMTAPFVNARLVEVAKRRVRELQRDEYHFGELDANQAKLDEEEAGNTSFMLSA